MGGPAGRMEEGGRGIETGGDGGGREKFVKRAVRGVEKDGEENGEGSERKKGEENGEGERGKKKKENGMGRKGGGGGTHCF